MTTQPSLVVRELAELFYDRDQAVLLLQRAAFPMSMMPDFRTPLEFWTMVAAQACKGALPNGIGIRPILDEAAKMYPSNPMLGRCRDLLAWSSWDHRTAAVLLSPPGAHPLHRLPEPSNAAHSSPPEGRSCWSFSMTLVGPVGAPSSKALTTILACVATSTISAITAVALGMLLHKPPEIKQGDALDPAGIVERHEAKDRTRGPLDAREQPEPRSSAMEDEDTKLMTLEEGAKLDEQEPRSKSRVRRTKKRAAPMSRSGPHEASSPSPPEKEKKEEEITEYRIYNCLVGPDEPDGKIKRNKKGECRDDDRRAFLDPPARRSSR